MLQRDEFWSRIRGLVATLVQEFLDSDWLSLCRTLEGFDDFSEQEVAIGYVANHLQGVESLRRVPLYAWWRDAQKISPNDAARAFRWEPMIGNWDRWAWDEGAHPGESRILPIFSEARVVWIPPGTFFMREGGEGEPRETKSRKNEVTITRGFWMWDTAVTREQFRNIMKEDPSYFVHSSPKAPAEQVTWSEGLAFCERISPQLGLHSCFSVESTESGQMTWDAGWSPKRILESEGFRLPSEAEWEYAARAGTKGHRYGELDDVAWWGGWDGKAEGNAIVEYEGAHPLGGRLWGTLPVRGKQPNAWGLYDMLGNVNQWCLDSTQRGYPLGPRVDPLLWMEEDAPGSRRLRGGGWQSMERWCRADHRDSGDFSIRNMGLGFRPVKMCCGNNEVDLS